MTTEPIDIYGVALDYVAVADAIAEALPEHRTALRARLEQSALELAVSVAAVASEHDADNAEPYRRASRVATECATMLDVCARLDLAVPALVDPGRGQLLEIVTEITQMARRRAAHRRSLRR